MLRKIYIPICMIVLFFLIPVNVHAFKHGYERKTDEIYATVRNDLAVYSDNSGEDFITYIARYKGIKVIHKEKSWYQIEYTSKKSGTQIGWITKDDFYADCLIYDGREKQRVANGDYQVTYSFSNQTNSFAELVSTTDTFDCTFEFIGDGLYYIKNSATGDYLQHDPLSHDNLTGFWDAKETAGTFYVIRKGNYFCIQDSLSLRYLDKNENGILYYSLSNNACWQLRRYDKAIDDDSLRVFAQFDADWASHYYGSGKNDDPDTNVFCTSACGIFATMNAIYSLTGMYADPYAMADYAVDTHYRILDNGTDSGFFKAAASRFGKKYGFSYDGSGGSIDQLKKKLQQGDVAIAHVPGHYTAIVDYDKKTKKFLLLDSHYLPKRATCAYGDWISAEDLESGNLMGQMYYYYKAKRP